MERKLVLVLGLRCGCPASLAAVNHLFGARGQARVERLRIHEAERFAAYRALYAFLSRFVATLFPPTDSQRQDFINLMKNDYFASVKPNMLLFSPSIRSGLQEFEGQYHCLRDPDLRAAIPFDEYIQHRALKVVAELMATVEKWTDVVLR